jgi:hypothetical protein
MSMLDVVLVEVVDVGRWVTPGPVRLVGWQVATRPGKASD